MGSIVNAVRRLLPGANSEGAGQVPFRMDKYGELHVAVKDAWAAANEGSYFVGTNPTMGTAVATTTSIQAYDATKPVMTLVNSGSKNIFLDYIRLTWGQVPTSATTWHWSMEVDPLQTRYASAGVAVDMKNVNPQGGAFGGVLRFGVPVTIAAGAARRFVHRAVGRSAIPVINDLVFFKFGGGEGGGGSTLGGTVAIPLIIPVAPVIIGPGETFCLMGWAASNAAAPSWEFDIGLIER